MAEFWFDTDTGDLLVGQAAAELRMEQSGPSVIPLSEVLNSDDPYFNTQQYEKMDTSSWSPDDYLNYGHWLVSLSEDQTVKMGDIRRMQYAGLGPSTYFLTKDFGRTVASFREHLGIRGGYDRGKYTDWSTADFIQHARNLETSLGSVPSSDDFEAAASRGDGPSYFIIAARVGGVSQLLELLGYPYIKSWEQADYIHWGVRVMQANDGRELIPFMTDVLVSRRRGPSSKTIIDHFDKWSIYKAQVTEAYAKETAKRQQRIAAYQQLANEGALPSETVELSTPELLAVGGRYQVAVKCAPKVTLARLQALALNETKSFISSLRKAAPSVTAGHIESQAVMLDVFDDIWPLDHQLEHLAVPEEELVVLREKENARKRRASLLGSAVL